MIFFSVDIHTSAVLISDDLIFNTIKIISIHSDAWIQPNSTFLCIFLFWLDILVLSPEAQLIMSQHFLAKSTRFGLQEKHLENVLTDAKIARMNLSTLMWPQTRLFCLAAFSSWCYITSLPSTLLVGKFMLYRPVQMIRNMSCSCVSLKHWSVTYCIQYTNCTDPWFANT